MILWALIRLSMSKIFPVCPVHIFCSITFHGTLEVFGESYTAENILSLRKRIGWISSSFFDNYYTQEMVLDIVLASLSGALGLEFTTTNSQIKKAKALLSEL